jgi:hypothetical protein
MKRFLLGFTLTHTTFQARMLYPSSSRYKITYLIFIDDFMCFFKIRFVLLL